MATSLHEIDRRLRELIVDQLVRLLERCDEIDVLLVDCLEEAEERFLGLVDAAQRSTEPEVRGSNREARHAGEGLPGEGAQQANRPGAMDAPVSGLLETDISREMEPRRKPR